MSFMLSYSIGMVFTGALGDVFRPTRVVAIASICVSAINIVFGCLSPRLTSGNWWPLYIVLWVINGLFQSCAWPVLVRLMSNWFGKGHSGSIFGIWSAHGSVGNIIGIGITAGVVSGMGVNESSIPWMFSLPALLLIVAALLTWALPDTKSDAGLPEESTSADLPLPSAAPTEKLSFWAAWLFPGVIRYSLCYACIKSINYAIFYWLTPFLEEAGHTAGTAYVITAMNDVGWIFGGLICGWVSDRMGSRAPVVWLFIVLSIIPTGLMYPCLSWAWVTGLLVTMNGFLCGGAGNIVASAVCADIGKNQKGSQDITGQVAGIIDGVGALGAALTQILIGYIPKSSLDIIFYILTGMLGVAALCIVDLAYREMKEYLMKRDSNKKPKLVEPSMQYDVDASVSKS
jgi:sugar phosphate permease